MFCHFQKRQRIYGIGVSVKTHSYHQCTFREKNNKIPDYLSREFNDCSEWMLNRDVKKICRRFFKPKIDLFATTLNTQIPDNYVSWFPDPNAV